MISCFLQLSQLQKVKNDIWQVRITGEVILEGLGFHLLLIPLILADKNQFT
jgi:hypothetical protein